MANSQTIKVYVLAGQSNMQGHGDLGPASTPGTLAHFAANDVENEFPYLLNGDDSWFSREDVWLRYDHENDGLLTGNLTVGYGGWNQQMGPELAFGQVMGEYHNEQVLLVKTCWGGKNLAVDFRPPSSGGEVGPYYTQMMADINSAIDNIATEFPDYADQTVELAGFCWFQGWNDGEEDAYLEEYEENLINLIADVRSDLGMPNLPFIIGLVGIGGYDLMLGDLWVQGLQTQLVPAQINAAEYEGHEWVSYAETRDFWAEADDSPSPGAIHHWRNNAESYLRVGHELGLEMMSLLDQTNPIAMQTHTHDISLFPNPTYDVCNIAGLKPGWHVKVFDMAGKELLQQSCLSSTLQMNVADLASGVYYVQIASQHNEPLETIRLIKS